MTGHRPFLEAILASPGDPVPCRLYLDRLRHEGQQDKREADRAARLAAWRDPPNHLARYYAVEYLFGLFGEETGHRPGDPIPQRRPKAPFRYPFPPPDPWRSFFYCLFSADHEDAARWLNQSQG